MIFSLAGLLLDCGTGCGLVYFLFCQTPKHETVPRLGSKMICLIWCLLGYHPHQTQIILGGLLEKPSCAESQGTWLLILAQAMRVGQITTLFILWIFHLWSDDSKICPTLRIVVRTHWEQWKEKCCINASFGVHIDIQRESSDVTDNEFFSGVATKFAFAPLFPPLDYSTSSARNMNQWLGQPLN